MRAHDTSRGETYAWRDALTHGGTLTRETVWMWNEVPLRNKSRDVEGRAERQTRRPQAGERQSERECGEIRER